MLAAYVAVTVVAVIANAYAAVLSFTHHKSVVETVERLRVPLSWMVPLGFLLAAGSLGLLAGFALPALGTAAACGQVLYFLSQPVPTSGHAIPGSSPGSTGPRSSHWPWPHWWWAWPTTVPGDGANGLGSVK